MDRDRLARVSEGQRACLRLVLEHRSSKDIARVLAISPHTVDQRIRFAMKALGAGSRVEAARILAAAEAEQGYQPLIYQLPDIDRPAGPPPASAPLEPEVRNAGNLPRTVWMLVAAAAALSAIAAFLIGLNALAEFTR
ncbi:MAG TPA: sigma factor-like helix-turn-helix DNA-binding protein [Allosphingosinicella sp.]|jgi:DNA-binding CsgD family transcriptional regulator